MPSEKRPRGHRGGAKQRDRERKKRQATEAPITAFRVTRAASHSEPSRVWPPTTPYFSAPIGAASVGRTPIGAAPNTPGYRAPGSPVFSTGAPGTPPVTGGFRAPGTPTAGFRASGTPTGFGAPGTPTAGFGAPGSPNFSAGFGAATPPMNFGAPGTPPLQFRVPGTPPVEHQRLQEETEPSAPGEPTVKEESDAAYFEAYDQMEVHALMLNDSQRLGSYLAAIRAHHLKGKKVLDVGAGSGILSLLAAKHGLAEHVWAVEAVPGMAKLAQQLVDQNGLQDKVTVINSKLEDATLPGKVDVIISEWMGFYLLHESMLESVLLARDKFLEPQGLMLPSRARIWAALVECNELRQELAGYEDFLGLDLSAVGEHQLEARQAEPSIEELCPRRLLAEPIVAIDLGDLQQLPVEGTRELQAQLCFRAWRRGHAGGIAFWFDVGFGHEVVLKTDPGSPATHWKQTVVYLGVFPEVEAGDVLEASVTMQQSSENPRHYTINIETS